MYKMVALDIDGTLVDKYQNISKRTITTISNLQEKKIFVTLCTGRNIHNTLPIAKKLNINIPLICVDGIVIFDPCSNKIIKEYTIEKKELKKIVEIGKNKDAYIELVTASNYYKYVKSPKQSKFDFVKDFNLCENFLNYKRGIRYMRNITDSFYEKRKYHVVIIGAEAEVLDEIKSEISSLNYTHLISEDTLWEGYIFVHQKVTNKGYGIKLLCDYFNIKTSEVIGIGDNFNDIAMFKMVGVSIAMGNASNLVKQHVSDVTKTVTQDGVAIALEKYFK